MDQDFETRQKILQHLRMLATPVDYGKLCDEGLLVRVSKRKFKLIDRDKLPAHVRLRLNCEIGPDQVVKFDDTEKIAKKLLKRLHSDLTAPDYQLA